MSSLPTEPDVSACQQIQSEKPRFNCEICHQSFRVKYQLTKHLKVHTGACHVKCPLCPKTLSRRDNALRHMQDTHSIPKEEGKRMLGIRGYEKSASPSPSPTTTTSSIFDQNLQKTFQSLLVMQYMQMMTQNFASTASSATSTSSSCPTSTESSQ